LVWRKTLSSNCFVSCSGSAQLWGLPLFCIPCCISVRFPQKNAIFMPSMPSPLSFLIVFLCHQQCMRHQKERQQQPSATPQPLCDVSQD